MQKIKINKNGGPKKKSKRFFFQLIKQAALRGAAWRYVALEKCNYNEIHQPRRIAQQFHSPNLKMETASREQKKNNV